MKLCSVLLLILLFETLETSRVEMAKFVFDFVRFYNFRQVYLLNAERAAATNASRALPGLSWAARAFLFLAAQPEGPFVSILDVGALAREDPEGSKDSGVNPLKAPGEGLLVFLMETEEDGLEFGKVFHGEARRSEWLLLAGPAFPHLLMGTYLPINSKVRIASTEDLQAYLLWEAYQVSESQDLRLVRTGQWQQHDAGGPFARSSSDEGETGHGRVFSGSSDGGARQGNMTETFARSDSAEDLNYQHGDAAETSEYQSQPNIMELRTVIDARANPGTIAPRFDFYSSDSLYNHGSTAFRIQMNTLTELSHSRGSNDSDTRRSRSQRSHNTAKERANTSGARAQPNSNHEAEPQPDLSNSLSQTAFLKRNKPQQTPPDAAPPNKQIILANRRFQKRNKIDPESITRAVNITELPEGRRVTKMMRFGSLEAPVDDPLQRRGDLTGLHLRQKPCSCCDLSSRIPASDSQQAPMAMLETKPDGSVAVRGVLGDLLAALREVTNLTLPCSLSNKNSAASPLAPAKGSG
ncbi:hypothetical protein C7M84_009072 [Penaeus vannamei]|uniref:Uncharacterized protein n=1 Tax=Penaeus vannamei TaxID=6689 RepID=A0A3R7SS37_PENVA|nr:hypothetical protein C7M84_009072 [Penaeus vannamei]